MDHSVKQISVLLIDDDEDDYLIIRNLLSKIPGALFKLDWCSDYDEAKELIASGVAEVYMVDYRLGTQNGLELLEEVVPRKRQEPFIILTGVGDGRVEQRAMKVGAADYLVKGSFDAELLSRAIRYALQRKRLEEERVQELIAINRAKDEFISVASHQLRTPATGVKQYIGMVLEGYAGDVNEAQQDMLTKAYESNERQLQIVSNLLRVAQVDAGKVLLRKTEVNIVQMIDDIMIEQLSKFESRNQKAVFEKPPKPIAVSIDKANFRMVIENLIDNASKYSQEGKVITVGLSMSKDTVKISVKDQGVGIKASDQDRLFEKFFRIDNPLSTLVGGTGLGLYWAKKIVDLHGGTIGISSTEGKGTTFRISIPLGPEQITR